MRKIKISIWIISLFLFVLSGNNYLSAQGNADTVKITLQDSEALFLKNNFRLLASKYSIEATRGAIIQAKIWNNPNLTVGQNVYNQYTHKWFDISSSGNTDVQLQQLILLGGKRSKQVKIAEVNSQLAEIQFYDIMRALKWEIRRDFFDLYFLQKTLQFYDESIFSVEKTVASIELIYEKRSILLNDVLRLKALLFSLGNEKLSIINQISDLQLDLRVLVGDFNNRNIYFVPLIDDKKIEGMKFENILLDTLISRGLDSRPDYEFAKTNIILEQNNLIYQKALAVPDLIVGGNWSRAGSYIPNYFGLFVSIDLPIFNRNQGNIQVSENTIKVNQAILEQTKLTVETDIVAAYNKAKEADKLFNSFDKSFPKQYAELVQDMTNNYQKRNITTIEFTDFYESFRTAMLQLNQLNSNRIDAFEALNYAVGVSIINP